LKKELDFSYKLLDFVNNSPSSFHVVNNVKSVLLKNGFKELNSGERWVLEKEGKYFVTKNDSALIAFVVGKGELGKYGFKLIGAHTDSPTFRIKPHSEIKTENQYLKLNTEVYGGPIINTWLDRPLSIAGRISVKEKNFLNPETFLLSIDKPIAVIPNLAIHMNRQVNDGIKLNTQKETLPILSVINEKFEKDNALLDLISENIGVDPESVGDFDLFLYEYEKGCIAGLNDEFISCGKLDDLAMVHGGLEALIDSEPSNETNVLVLFDNEEVGSSTKQGADSPMLENLLERICISLKKDREDFFRAFNNSFLISADMTHALHPNYPEKQDPTNRPIINKGPAIKISANQSYTSDSVSSTVFQSLCNGAGVPVQIFVNRSDMRGGSTIGPISSTHLGISSVDVGNPILAMHSIKELGGVYDHYYMYKVFKELYKI
jgi:aspartyl aminopeptidase